jgi:transcriptional regulator with PAS, ATPase and Fis domain
LHDHHQQRRSKPYNAINCAGFPETLIESELFGYTKGAFTGAFADNKGIIHQSDKGTLFLDEIGDMPLQSQAKILRFAENGSVRALGAQRETFVDVRFIAGTNAALEDAVEEKRFRLDLFYRLNVFPINLPPLRERTEDIPALVQHFCAAHARKHNMEQVQFASSGIGYLQQLAWPGNVRQLRSALEYLTITNQGREITDGIVHTAMRGPAKKDRQAVTSEVARAFHEGTRKELMRMQMEYRLRNLSHADAAKSLGLSSKTIYNRTKAQS